VASEKRKMVDWIAELRPAICQKSNQYFSVTITYIFDEHLFFLIRLTILARPVIRLDYTS
jgi:hypothetical protein